ncbi:7574_t:CDS:2 [Diversispora eburnea]|uniref:7574_t:CDS:1 n=1 Tax=Diversispora eburnea TaxID=1213867 RepID=A0A9N9BQX1_9GLOM|nr:7574_t:CDS:2 [Diversispora eburnea]
MVKITNDYFERNPATSSYQSLEEAEAMLYSRPFPTDENPIEHKGDNSVNHFASILNEGSASAFY